MARLNNLPDVGPNCESVQDALEQQVSAGLSSESSLSTELKAHLKDCPECQDYLELLQTLELALLDEIPAVAVAPQIKAQLMQAVTNQAVTNQAVTAQQVVTDQKATVQPLKRSFGWWPALGWAAGITGVLVLSGLFNSSRVVASSLPDPAVVVNTDSGLLVANNDRSGTLNLISRNKVTASLATKGKNVAWFTQGVRLGKHVYLADTANDRVLEIDPLPLNIVKIYSVPNGVAGLTATSGPNGGRVFFKSSRGAVGQLGGKQITIATEAGMPLADVMDGVVYISGKLFVTHHVSGEVCILNADTLSVEKRIKLGGMPVALALYEHGGKQGLLVLDVMGRLLQLDAVGKTVKVWPIAGHPDKLTLNAEVAVVTDRAGTVTRINLLTGQLKPMLAKKPMDVLAMPDGEFIIAESGKGVVLLDSNLNTRMELDSGPTH